MPRSRSWSFESITRSVTSSLLRNTSDCLSIASTSVVYWHSHARVKAKSCQQPKLLVTWRSSTMPTNLAVVDVRNDGDVPQLYWIAVAHGA